MASTNSARLERWLGADNVEQLSSAMTGWYGPPIGVGNTPGRVYATGDGDFIGTIRGGRFSNLVDYQVERITRLFRRLSRENRRAVYCNTGIASLSDLIYSATSIAGSLQQRSWSKVSPTSNSGASTSLWRYSGQPVAGSAASAAPGGTVCDSSTDGGLTFVNAGSSDTQHIVSAFTASSLAGSTYLLYDRLFAVAKTASSTATEAVTGVPTRYQSTTPAAADSAEGNFAFPEVGTSALGATAHNWDAIQYTDQGGTTGVTAPSAAGVSGGAQGRIDLGSNGWFLPLASGDVGVQALTQLKCSASVTGALDWVIGHPLLWMPCGINNNFAVNDAINTAFNLVRIFNDSCLAFLEINRSGTTAATGTGTIFTVTS